ncbi:CDGSH iron-sulfur domain-containing protein 3, mitochondrial [Dirofilaria immitis]|nr:CDGSH iron-sulfur domain-containing protein 3, mitochondrial [Dirofilaria immitis]
MFRNISDSIVNIRGVHIAFKILSRTKSEVKLLNPSATWYPEIGICLDEKPIILKLRKGERYSWCSCGLSGKQPWCDGSHSAEGVTTLRPLHFEVEKDGEYSVCGCKATKNRPLCDGSHVKVKKRRYTDPPQYCAYAESPVYEGVANKLGYKPKEGRWHF